MGCDIHFYVERRNKKGVWVFTKPVKPPCNTCEGTGKKQFAPKATAEYNADVGAPCWFCDGKGIDPYPSYYSGRNYDLFAMLADVRNGRGFAGIKTGEGFNPIAEPKGLPDDASKQMKKAAEDYGEDGHSHSYLTLAELEKYDWDQVTQHQGYVTSYEYEEWVEKGKVGGPSSWCGGVSGGSVKIVTNFQMEELIREGKAGKKSEEKVGPFGIGASYYTPIKWHEYYRESAGSFYTKTLPALRELAEKHGGPENIRIVFFFDN